MKKLLFLLCAVLLIAAFSGCRPGTLDIPFTNGTDWSFTFISISEERADSPAADLLGAAAILKAGGTVQLAVAASSGSGLYDIRCVDEDGDTWLITRVPLSKGASLSVYLNSDGYPVVEVTDSKGGVADITGEFEGEIETAAPVNPTPAPIPAPSKDDPLDMTYDLQAFPGGILIPYPSTMQVLRENAETRTIWLDAVNDPGTGNNICVDFIQITDFDKYFGSGEAQAKIGLDKLFNAVIDIRYKDYYINSIGSEFMDGGSFYGLRHYIWLSGGYFADGGNAPIRGVMELRYCGPTGYLLCVLTAADENAIQRYFDVALNITNAIPLGGGWSTSVQSSGGSGGGSGWSDPGDWDYDPWSDPGDWDYDPWSDPGDTWDYDPWSDPGDGYDEWSDPGDTW
jgi:hypothetical protein